MFLRPEVGKPLLPATAGVIVPIVTSTLVAAGLGLYPGPVVELMKEAAIPMLQTGSPRAKSTEIDPKTIVTDEERAERNRKQYEEDQRTGNVFHPGAGGAGGAPGASSKGTPKKDANASPPDSPKAPGAGPKAK